MIRQIRWHFVGLLCTVAVALPGCGGSLAQVTGRVTHNGEPVGKADVVVESVSDTSLQFFGMTSEDGALYVGYRDKDGVPLGPCQIRVTHHTLRDGTRLPPGEEGQALRSSNKSIGKVYRFDQDLKAGKNDLDLKLEEAADVQPLRQS
ncbi:MAG: hypothetical protein KJ000_19855 [Pirellulaceae bacterium]|nr:hypothetical protein [Pirellulaceae bacterium]